MSRDVQTKQNATYLEHAPDTRVSVIMFSYNEYYDPIIN